MTKYSKGDYTNTRYDICEILRDGERYCTVATADAELIIGVLLENEQLKKENEYFKELLDRYEIESNDFDKFMNSGENIRLSINIETGKLQRHIYATGQWFGDFDRVLCENWISKEDYQRFIDRVIEVYNTEFKGGVE